MSENAFEESWPENTMQDSCPEIFETFSGDQYSTSEPQQKPIEARKPVLLLIFHVWSSESIWPVRKVWPALYPNTLSVLSTLLLLGRFVSTSYKHSVVFHVRCEYRDLS
uniref:Uncharacterized protein n=1 Tax=Amphora coffeiformis TaxID=265554 RepID=A0A7S3L3B2_9STRA|mmetsp:Transcript_16131/g.30708  ORF Transcript_16131/g.30708 Transcript_16131/m.30708 type:complete len:109 (+) Transcript_16131:287-613(+)